MLKKQSIAKMVQYTGFFFSLILLNRMQSAFAEFTNNDIGNVQMNIDVQPTKPGETKAQKLEGEVEEKEYINESKRSLDSKDGSQSKQLLPGTSTEESQNDYLKGNVRENGPLKGLVQERVYDLSAENPAMQGEDPDAADKELMIEWDRWRNRFLQAVLSGTTDILNSDQAQNFQFNPATNAIESKYPMGTIAWFTCTVNRERQIKDVHIVHTSGFPNYDQAVKEAVQSLAGSSILKFPANSKRVSVLQGGGVVRTSQAEKQYFRFGDVERYRVPGNQ